MRAGNGDIFPEAEYRGQMEISHVKVIEDEEPYTEVKRSQV